VITHLFELDAADKLNSGVKLPTGIGVLRVDREAFLEVQYRLSWAENCEAGETPTIVSLY
jgi:hypothetical protein